MTLKRKVHLANNDYYYDYIYDVMMMLLLDCKDDDGEVHDDAADIDDCHATMLVYIDQMERHCYY